MPKMARKPKAGRKKATSGRIQPKTSKLRKAVRDKAVKLLSRAGGATPPELMKAFKWQAHSVRGFISVLASKHGFKIESLKVDRVRTYVLNRQAGRDSGAGFHLRVARPFPYCRACSKR